MIVYESNWRLATEIYYFLLFVHCSLDFVNQDSNPLYMKSIYHKAWHIICVQ